MKILCILPQPPWPEDNGQKLVNALTLEAMISQGWTTEVLTFASTSTTYTRPDGITVTTVAHRGGNSLMRAVHAACNGRPYTIDKYYTSEMAEAVRRAVCASNPDVVHVETMHMAHYIKVARAAGAMRIGLRLHNVEHLIWERFFRSGRNVLLRFFAALQRGAVREFEMSALRAADVAMPISTKDAESLRGIAPSVQFHVLLPAIGRSKKSDLAKGSRVLFLGSLDWVPNQDAALWLADEIAPLLRATAKDSEIVVAGRKPPRWLVAKLSGKVKLCADVSDLTQLYESAALVIVPIRMGGGVRLKILEAMAFGRPVVSTTIGCEGLDLKDGDEILVGDTAEDLVRLTHRLICDAEMANKIASQGRAVVAARHSVDAIAKRLMSIYG